MIKNVIVGLFLLVFFSSIVMLFFRGEKTFYEGNDSSGARCVIEDLDILEYKGVKQEKMSRAKLGVIRENGIAELFTMIKFLEFDETGKISKKALADHAILQSNTSNIFLKTNQNIEIQRVELESNIHILDSKNNFVSEKINFENHKLSSSFPTVVTDGNMSIYSKEGFIYDIDSGVLNIDAPVKGEIGRWHY